jgi:hypothetical protein
MVDESRNGRSRRLGFFPSHLQHVQAERGLFFVEQWGQLRQAARRQEGFLAGQGNAQTAGRQRKGLQQLSREETGPRLQNSRVDPL